jgi:hypothetical protein
VHIDVYAFPENSADVFSVFACTVQVLDTPMKSQIIEHQHVDPEQQLNYLKQAFSGFVNARTPAELQQLGRVISLILAFSPEEQTKLNENISKMTPVNDTALDNISAGIASFFW